MHENRETSGTSRSNQDRDRPEKANSRTADRHVAEESDRAIVPVNLSNKEGQTSAEIGEGRARAKENIAPSHNRPTESGKRVSQGLSGVRQAARKETGPIHCFAPPSERGFAPGQLLRVEAASCARGGWREMERV